MAKQTKKDKLAILEQIAQLQEERAEALEQGKIEIAKELKAKIETLKNGSKVVSNYDLDKDLPTFNRLKDLYNAMSANNISTDEYRANSQSSKKAKVGETAEKLGIYTAFDDSLFAHWCSSVKVNKSFNGKGTSIRHINYLACKVFDNIKNFYKEIAEQNNIETDRDSIIDNAEKLGINKDFDKAFEIIKPFIILTTTEPKAEPTEPKAEPTEPKAEPTEPKAEPKKGKK